MAVITLPERGQQQQRGQIGWRCSALLTTQWTLHPQGQCADAKREQAQADAELGVRPLDSPDQSTSFNSP